MWPYIKKPAAKSTTTPVKKSKRLKSPEPPELESELDTEIFIKKPAAKRKTFVAANMNGG